MPSTSSKYHVQPDTLAFYEKGPGPGKYNLPPLFGQFNKELNVTTCEEDIIPTDPRFKTEPAWSIGKKFYFCDPEPQESCEPEVYNGDCNRCLIGPTIKSRHPPPEDFDLCYKPGPGDYCVPPAEVYKRKAPAFTMRPKLEPRVKCNTSGEYVLLPNINGTDVIERISAPAVSLKGRWKEKCGSGNGGVGSGDSSPGPIYDARKGDCYCELGFSFGRRDLKCPPSGDEPGPASYSVECVRINRPRTPAFSFGIRYNEFTGTFRTKCDDSARSMKEILNNE